MNKIEIEVLECAEKIKKYCRSVECKSCYFRNKEIKGLCDLACNPSFWEIPKKQILDNVEKEYLWNIIKPFKDKVSYIEKNKGLYKDDAFIRIALKEGSSICFPYFKKNEMYIGMELYKRYTVKELFGGND